MTGAELIAAALAVVAVYLYCLARWGNQKEALLQALVCAPFLAFSAWYGGQFLTADEYVIVEAILSDGRQAIIQGHIEASAFRTSLFLYGPIFRLADLSTWSDTSVAVLKLCHWGVGLACLLGVFHLANEVAQDRLRGLTGLTLGLLMCLPTNLAALKTFNYDLLSVGLGVVSLLCLMRALQTSSARYALAAVAFGYLASQEKLISSPLFLAALIGYAHVRQMALPKLSLGRLAFDLLAACGLALGLGVVTHYGIAWGYGLPMPGFGYVLKQATFPFVSYAWGMMRFLTRVTNFADYTAELLLLTFTLIFVATVALTLARRRIKAAPEALLRLERYGGPALMALVFVIAAVGVFRIVPYWAPFHPIAPGRFTPSGEFNGVVLHFGARSRLGHLVRHTAYAYVVFVCAVPTAIWMLGLLGTTVGYLRRCAEGVVFRRLLLLSLLVPAAFGLLNINVANRYLNLFLCLFLLGAVGSVAAVFRQERPRLLFALLLAALVGTAAEVAPFQPLGAAFRPLWVSYADARTPQPGRINPSWVGWGEETVLAGRYLVDRDGGPIRLYCRYPGRWLCPGPDAEVIDLWRLAPEDTPGLSERDYFMLNRSIIVQGMPHLSGVEPDLVVDYRGFAIAWVYRGDKLRRAGYVYDPTLRFFRRP